MYSDCCSHLYCYIHNVLGWCTLFQVFLDELESLRETVKWTLYLISGSRLFSFRLQILSYGKYSLLFYLESGLNLQILSLRNTLTKMLYQCVLLDNLQWIFGTNKPDVCINLWDSTYYYYAWFLSLLIL